MNHHKLGKSFSLFGLYYREKKGLIKNVICKYWIKKKKNGLNINLFFSNLKSFFVLPSVSHFLLLLSKHVIGTKRNKF